MFWVFKLSFVVDILAFFDLATFGLFFENFGNVFSNRLVTLPLNEDFCSSSEQTTKTEQKTRTNFQLTSQPFPRICRTKVTTSVPGKGTSSSTIDDDNEDSFEIVH
jgi:hypothetical protein